MAVATLQFGQSLYCTCRKMLYCVNECIITRFGPPKIIHTDEGRQFHCRLIDELGKNLNNTYLVPNHIVTMKMDLLKI
ncbi:hypothetical protein A3Q56_08014 [Intoshia linei]|uniref:Integrase catalytic domain-containing protein n=1 Tax=Intoshia linei TaxID=1819745 RepID=A0A177AS15_9BILA|nr:hypothetical protein A3Q56_08014 [Intoshia linei]